MKGIPEIIVYRVANHWALNRDELRTMRKYLRGPQICRDWDRLPSRVQAAVKELKEFIDIPKTERRG